VDSAALAAVPAPTKTDSVQTDSVKADSVAAATTKADSAKKRTPPKKPLPASRPCVLDMTESPPETRLLYSRISETISNTFIGGGFVGRCQGENNRLRADSAEQFQAAGIVNLYGNVVYEEPNKMQITATHATYFTREGRLYADGNVVATQLATGSTFMGPSIEYFRSTPERPASRLVAPSRSTATLIEKDSTGKRSPPTTVQANRFEDAGDSLLMAWGDVQIDREKINARSDSAAFDKLTEQSRLIRGARIVNRDSAQRFTLVGDTIDMFSKARKLDRVVARHKSVATRSDLVLNAEIIDIRLKEQELEEAFAFGAGRAKATTPQQDVVADSMRIRLADKQVREVRAVGDAMALGSPDSIKIVTKDKDVLRGDSIFAFFDSTAADTAKAAAPVAKATANADSNAGPKVKEIRALGNASSLFHIASAKGRQTPPSINYVRGVRIFVNFDTGAVRDVRVDSAASGVYLEPAPDSLTDTLPARLANRRGQGGAPPSGTPPARPPRRPPPSSPEPQSLAVLSPADSRRRP
jgi:lipopolysaccharide export system protein LptA